MSLKWPRPKLQFWQRSRRMAPLSWQWSTNQCFLPFPGLSVLQIAQQLLCATTMASYSAIDKLYWRLRFLSRKRLGLIASSLALDFLFISLARSGSDALRARMYCFMGSGLLAYFLSPDFRLISRLRSGLSARHLAVSFLFRSSNPGRSLARCSKYDFLAAAILRAFRSSSVIGSFGLAIIETPSRLLVRAGAVLQAPRRPALLLTYK